MVPVGGVRVAGEGTLRPVRWRGLPRGGTLLRVALVAMLLGVAAAVLSTPAGCPPPGEGRAGPASATPVPAAPGPAAPAPGPSTGALPLPSGSVGVPVRLAEPAALAVLRPGARVDLLVVPAGTAAGEATLLAPRALVLDVVGAAGAVDGSSALYLALRPEQAQQAVGVPEGSRFAVVVRG
ncbi:flagellar biosynthesis protein FlgA [Micromonospora yasonensis]|uniref:flagellar biosynthesis protein FlgA n=1 Tax=Micromonospora yasonensis TaxID=1128667 RepID=UPI002232745C|nr:flagellar biosynthesis protein FlgA [Micromonospora yasonensis]MCW3841870.1 flagellar biosynthesis protein FlgA [Micromonospora yasonensis]